MLKAAHDQARVERQIFLAELTHIAEIPQADRKFAQALRDFYLRDFNRPNENQASPGLTPAQNAQLIAERLALKKRILGHG